MTYAQAKNLLTRKQMGEALTASENRLIPIAMKIVANYWGAPR